MSYGEGNTMQNIGGVLVPRPRFQILMQWRIKDGKHEKDLGIYRLGQQLVNRLELAGIHEINYSICYFSSEWVGWRLFECHDLSIFHETLQELREAPEPTRPYLHPDPATPHLYPGFRNTGGIELDRWLETKFTIGVSRRKGCNASRDKLWFGQVAVLEANVFDLDVPSGESDLSVTFTIVEGAATLTTETNEEKIDASIEAERNIKVLNVESQENGIATVRLVAHEPDTEPDTEPQPSVVKVFVHRGPPAQDNYERPVSGDLLRIEVRPGPREAN